MDNNEKERLIYRRQYVLTTERIKPPFQYREFFIGADYVLYTHVDLNVSHLEETDLTIILLGDIFDYRYPEKNNEEILKDISDSDFQRFIRKTERYTGRYVLIYRFKDRIFLLTDVISARKVFYTLTFQKPWFSSQPHLLAKVAGFKLTSDESLLSYYHSPVFNRLFNANIGDLTCYDEIHQLRINHYYDCSKQKPVRFWPYQKITHKPVTEAAAECASIIKGYCDSLTRRYKKVMLPVTGGKDSRILFAAIKDSEADIYYYINDDGLTEPDDISIPKSILSKFGKEFHIEAVPQQVNTDFSDVYFQNNPFASEQFLPFIYNYYKNYECYVNLPGNIASAGLEHYKFSGNNITPDQLAYLNWVMEYPFARKYFSEWLEEVKPLSRQYGIEVLSLFYWEERLGNWGTQIQIDKDIAQEDINLFNSYDYISNYFSVRSCYVMTPGYKLHKLIVRDLCMDCMKDQFNKPKYKFLKSVLQRLGLFQLVYEARLKLKTR